MTIMRWIGVIVLLGLFWMFRSLLPFMFFSDAGIEVILNVPASVSQPTVTAGYKSRSCEWYGYGSDTWHYQTNGKHFETEKISETQYKVKIPYRDHSPCGWRLQSLGWSLDLKDASLMNSKVASDEGGGAGIGVKIVYEPEHWLNLYQDGVFVIDDEIIPRVYFSDPSKGNKYVHREGKYVLSLRSHYYEKKLEYGTRDADGREKIIYNATINEDKLTENVAPGNPLW
ncbi:MAG: hypothetical protein JKY74_02265 [Shewanella sp.]|nr:hypothetical protein [Shewanella sp.]